MPTWMPAPCQRDIGRDVFIFFCGADFRGRLRSCKRNAGPADLRDTVRNALRACAILARRSVQGERMIKAMRPAFGAGALAFIVFALSGCAGLIYQSIWTQYLGLFLGHAAYAQSLVLAIFMGGMAAGAWWASRVVHWRNLLRAYAW